MDKLSFHIKGTIAFHKAMKRYRENGVEWMAQVCEQCADHHEEMVRQLTELTSKSSPSTF